MRITSFSDYQKVYKRSIEQPELFWDEIANTFTWQKKWEKTLQWNFADYDVKWFANGKLNITENCLDRHLSLQGNKIAFYYEPNNPEQPSKTITYKELHVEVCRFAHVLKNNGVKKGDRVCLYMPMCIEAVVAMLACARMGAVHSVVFGGFSAKSLSGRINDSTCKVLITADAVYRGSKMVPLKEIADEALQDCNSIEKVIVLNHSGVEISMFPGRDVWWHEEIQGQPDFFKAEPMDSEDMLFILYTSGSTGKPKGVVHTTAGYMVYSQYTFENVFQPKPDSIYWCTADVGWITGHTYIVYGPLLAGVSGVIFEGIPTFPDAGRFWQVIDKYRVTHFYTAPTAIRALEAAGLDYVKPYQLDSLQVLGSVGEPINEEAWHWYHKNIGKERCPIADTWWQTETGGILISPLAGITQPLKPGFATLPLPGIQPVLVNEKGEEIEGKGIEGNLCIRFPWPGMLRTTYGDHERCKQTYFSTYRNLYFTGDGCKRDLDGYYRITGRVDDVINVSGHRIGTAEVESAINLHTDIVESAVVGFPHPIKGQGIYAYVIRLKTDTDESILREEINAHVVKEIGAIARPDKIQFVSGLPKTRSGKIMRRILRKIAEGDTDNLGDVSTLLDPMVVEEIKIGAEKI